MEALAELKEKMLTLEFVQAPGAIPCQTPLIGRQLTKFDDIDIDFTLEQADNKMVLLCFCDIDQRLSRRWLMQLREGTDELKEKGVVVAAVQVSKLDRGKLDQWMKDNNIRFSMGMITGDLQTTLSIWGVKSQPRLILTDKQHKVICEGISVDELKEMMK